MADLFDSGIELMLIGMGIVFLFLGLLVATVNGMSRIVCRWFPDQPPPTPSRPSRTAAAQAEKEDIVAVIGAAIHRYRTEHRN
ncbi:MAG: OadG family protein [Methylohalobius sp. ZOD2]